MNDEKDNEYMKYRSKICKFGKEDIQSFNMQEFNLEAVLKYFSKNFITFSISKILFSNIKEMQFLTTSSLWALLKTVLDFSIMETMREVETYVKQFIVKTTTKELQVQKYS